MLNSLTEIRIVVTRALEGSKRAVRFGDGLILVSPAMWNLLKYADGDELRRMLEAIPLLELPSYEWPPRLAWEPEPRPNELFGRPFYLNPRLFLKDAS